MEDDARSSTCRELTNSAGSYDPSRTVTSGDPLRIGYIGQLESSSCEKNLPRIMLALFRIVHRRLFPVTNDVVLCQPMKVDQKKLVNYKQVCKLGITNYFGVVCSS